MSTRFFRSKIVLTTVVAFSGGVLFASGMDLTRYSWAQPTKTTGGQSAVRGPNSPDVAGSFATVAERVTPSVVAIKTVQETGDGPNRDAAIESYRRLAAGYDATVGELLDRELRGRRSFGRLSRDRGLGFTYCFHHALQKCSDFALVRSSRRFMSSSNTAVTSVCRSLATSKNSALDALWQTIMPRPAPPWD